MTYNYKRNSIIYSLVTINIGFLTLFSNVFAVQTEEKGNGIPTSIYLCTKDLDNSPSGLFPTPQEKSKELRQNNAACNASSLAYDVHNSTTKDYVFIPYYNGNECHYFLRHCFLVQAVKLGEDTINGKKLLHLKYLGSRGFGGDGMGGVTTYSEDIFLNDQYKNKIISCKLAFDKNNLTDEDLRAYGNVKGAMSHKWAEVTTAMENEVEAGYDPSTHSCCTVAYKALEKISPNIQKIVDPMEINYGIGVEFTGISGAISASIVSESREVSDSSGTKQEQDKRSHEDL